MRRLGPINAIALALPVLALPAAALANSLTLNIWPSDDPDSAVFCALTLSDGQISVIEARGLGMQNPRALRWWANRADADAFLHAMQALVSGAVPSQNPLLSPRPRPPFLTVTWIANLDGRVTSGRYTGNGLFLPAELAEMLDTVTPGSSCRSALLH